MGHSSQAVSAVGARALSGHVRSLTWASGGPPALPQGWNTAPVRGQRRPAPETHLLVLVGTHCAGRGEPPGRRRSRLRESARGSPEAGASLFCALDCGRHTLRTADESHTYPRVPRQRKAAGKGALDPQPVPAADGARMSLGRDSGAVTAEAPPSLPSCFSYWLLASLPPTPALLGNGASSLRFVEQRKISGE